MEGNRVCLVNRKPRIFVTSSEEISSPPYFLIITREAILDDGDIERGHIFDMDLDVLIYKLIAHGCLLLTRLKRLPPSSNVGTPLIALDILRIKLVRREARGIGLDDSPYMVLGEMIYADTYPASSASTTFCSTLRWMALAGMDFSSSTFLSCIEY